MTALTFEDPVDIVYDALNAYTWTTDYTAKPQLIKERDKGIKRAPYNQTPSIGNIHIMEIPGYGRKRADALWTTEDVTMGVTIKMSAKGTSEVAIARVEQIFSGIEAIRRKNRCSGTGYHAWEFRRQTGLKEWPDMVSRTVDHELFIYKQDVTTED